MALFALVCIVVSQAAPAPVEGDAPAELAAAPETAPLRNRLEAGPAGGLSLGLPVAGWVGFRVRWERTLGDQGYFGVLGELSGGVGMLSPRANLLLGYDLFESRTVDWDWQLYVGWPLVGVQQRFELRPVRISHFEFSLGEQTSAELLPNIEAELFVRIAVPVEEWTASLKVWVEAGVGIRSSAHVGPAAQLLVARRF